MYLLSGKSLTKADWFRPERMALNLEERKSTATLTLGPEAPEIQMGAWLLDDEEPGAGIVWRVKTVNIQYDTETRTVTLEHIANALKDLILFGETKPTDMRAQGSTAPEGKCYAAEALAYILSKHSMFTLGTVAAAYSSVSNPYNFNGENLFTALETVTGSLSDCYWSFDLSAIPFTISFLQLGSDVDSEMRMGRNITTLRKTVDTSRMYTRFYPIGKDDLHITGNYVSRNENTYGVIEKVETDQSKTTAEELTAWANERLSRHAEPSVTITISGLDLSAATGEPLDHFVINKKCRVPLPEFNTTITEKVTKLSWSDKIGAPEAVTATLANLTEDLASIINNANKASSKGGRTSAKQSKDDHAWFVDTEDHVAMIAEAVGGSVIKDGQVVNWSRVASLVVDGEGIHQRVTAAAGDATLSKSWIEQNETSIMQGVQDATGAKSWVDQNGSSVTAGVAKISTLEEKDVELEGRLDLAAGQASLLVTATDNRPIKTYSTVADFPATGSASYLYYSLGNKKYYEWTNGAYSETTPGNTINRAGIIATINEDGTSTTKILGNKVLIGGVGTSVSLSDVMNITNDVAHFKKNVYFDKEVTIANTPSAGLNLYTLNFVGSNTYTLTPPDVANMIAKAEVDSNTNTLKLWKYSEKNETDPTLTFSKATSLSGNWSGNTYTVTATPQGNTNSVTPNIHHIAKDGTDDHILNTYIGTNSGGTWTNHGNVVKLYMVQNGTKVELNNINQPSSAGAGVVTYAEKAINVSLEDKGTNYATGSTQTITPGSGYTGISRIVIGAVTVSAVDSGVTLSGIPANVIKSGVTIKVGDSGNTGRHVNVTGTYGAGNLMAESVYPSLYNQVVLPDPPYDGLSKVTIYAVQTTNLNTYNIVKGVTVKIGRAGDAACIASVAGSYVPTLSGNWSGNTYTVTATPEGSISVTPSVHHIVKDGTDDHILNTYIGTNSGGTWTDHGNVVKLYMVQNGSKVELNNINQPSSAGAGVVTYAEKALNETLEDKGTVYATGSTQAFTPSSGKYGISRIAIGAVTHSCVDNGTVISGDIPANVIKSGVTIKVGDSGNTGRHVNVTGTYSDYWDGFDAGWRRYYDLWEATYDTPGDGTYSYIARSPIDHNDGNYTKVYSGVVPGSGGTTYYSRTMRCTSIEPTYPGSSTNYYYFRLEGNYDFSADTNYNMYRASWPAGN